MKTVTELLNELEPYASKQAAGGVLTDKECEHAYENFLAILKIYQRKGNLEGIALSEEAILAAKQGMLAPLRVNNGD